MICFAFFLGLDRGKCQENSSYQDPHRTATCEVNNRRVKRDVSHPSNSRPYFSLFWVKTNFIKEQINNNQVGHELIVVYLSARVLRCRDVSL